MICKVINTDKAPGAIGPYSQAVFSSPLLFVSGQLGMNPGTGDLVSDELSGQARQALDNLCNIVKAAGGSITDIACVDVFITDMKKFGEFNSVYQEFFSEHKPARAVVEVSALPKGACVEIKCIAQIK
ncbi:2-iminobutanoate/2-iminopropanoate deaminase [Desulfonema limicola]|uniref:2-iminobutanoate/2-iminopropanoate deaminase n=1 Tax=Desulfonema limicola TaxID=45656 RepID=A0A975BCL3_9BACT|nr:Rid family detoxifying hydrolase [Desulfonema limicola]QTA82883.1 2-iminobutanoate/2-iminopropanoate deaminase [Desulfonema limicola]